MHSQLGINIRRSQNHINYHILYSAYSCSDLKEFTCRPIVVYPDKAHVSDRLWRNFLLSCASVWARYVLFEWGGGVVLRGRGRTSFKMCIHHSCKTPPPPPRQRTFDDPPTNHSSLFSLLQSIIVSSSENIINSKITLIRHQTRFVFQAHRIL